MHAARITDVERVREYLGFPVLRIELEFLEDGDVGQTKVVAGRAALGLRPGDEVGSWTDDDGILAGIVHAEHAPDPEVAFQALARVLGVELDGEDEGLQLVAELRDHEIIVAMTEGWTLYLGVETELDAIDDEFELDFRHMFDPDDQLPTEVVVRGALVADLEKAGEAAMLPAAMSDALLARIDRLTETMDAPLLIDHEGVSIAFTTTVFDADLWMALLGELIELWHEIDRASRSPLMTP